MGCLSRHHQECRRVLCVIEANLRSCCTWGHRTCHADACYTAARWEERVKFVNRRENRRVADHPDGTLPVSLSCLRRSRQSGIVGVA